MQSVSENVIQAKITQQLELRAKAEYDLERHTSESTRIRAIIEMHDQQLAMLKSSYGMMAEVEAQILKAYENAAKAAAPTAPAPSQAEEPVHVPASKATRKAAEKPKRRGRPPGRKSKDADADEPTPGNGLTVEQAAFQ